MGRESRREAFSMKVSDDRREAYVKAYDDWQRQLQDLHAVFLDGSRTPVGDQFKGLLNREARAKERYDQARLALLGIPQPSDSPFD
jgi:hypothetical protein